MKKLCCVLVLLALLVGIAAAEVHEGILVNGLTADRVHLRYRPNEDAASLGLYFTGTLAICLDYSADWVQVRIGTETGWMKQEYLPRTSVAPEDAFQQRVVTHPDGSFVNLRSTPSMSAEILFRCDSGEWAALMGETASGWGYVEINGQKGYMQTKYLAAVEDAPFVKEAQTSVVGTTADGKYIHAHDTGEGQTIYFVAWDERPKLYREDVNFDGRQDIVAITGNGAKNRFFDFFVWDGARYVRAEHPGTEDGLVDYVLYPELDMVSSNIVSGPGEAVFERLLFRWEGTELRLMRKAVSRLWSDTLSAGDGTEQAADPLRLHVTITDYANGYVDELIFSDIIDMDRMDEAYYASLEVILWEGLT